MATKSSSSSSSSKGVSSTLGSRVAASVAARNAQTAANIAAKGASTTTPAKTTTTTTPKTTTTPTTAPVPTTTTTAPKTYSYVINGKPITLSAAQYATLSPTSQAALNAQYSPTAVTPILATAPTASTTAGASTTTSVIDAWNKLSTAAKQNAVSTWNQGSLDKITAAGGVLPSKLGDTTTQPTTETHTVAGDVNVPASGTNTESIVAANDKRYTVSLNPANGKYEFTSLAPGGGTKSFNTRQEAINAISAGNGGIKSFSDGQTAATTPVSENEKVIQQYKDEIKLMQDAQNVKDEENRNFMTNMFNTMTQQQAASAGTIQGITDERMTGLQNTYTDIDNLMNQLEIKANAVFDQGAMRQAVAKAKQLEAQGYMTNEQVAQVANYDVSAYRRDAELAKTTLEKDIAAQRITLDQSKLAAVDAIQKDMSINEQQRAANIQQINTRYGNMTDSLNSKESASKQLYEGLNNQYNQMAAGQDVAQQGVLGADTAQYNLQQQQKQRAISDPVARRDYIINQVKDSNVLKYVDTVIKKMQQSGNFMAADVDTLMQNVLAQATLLQKQNEAAGAHAGMSGTTPTTTATPTAPVTNTSSPIVSH